jgi:hypothetical protein
VVTLASQVVKLAVNLILSLGMLALCLWLVWPSSTPPPCPTGINCELSEMGQIELAFRKLEFASFAPYLGAYFGLMLVQHLCRSLRWNYLLAPLGIRVPPGPLLAISSVGFMAILALPLRLGEFVRPGPAAQARDLGVGRARHRRGRANHRRSDDLAVRVLRVLRVAR